MTLTKSANSWLADSAFNLLVDYYTEVQFRPYGSGATRRNVLPFLRALKLGYLCIYAKGHSGYTSWPSRLKTQHEMLAQDMPKFFRKVTREAGTRLVLYYSGLLDGLAGQRHPDWLMRDEKGAPCRNLFKEFGCSPAAAICPLSAYWDRWVSVQLRELIESYAPDGIWVDGDWPGPCHCARCQERFRRDTGWKEPWRQLIQRHEFRAEYRKVWNRITHEWRTRFNQFIKSLKPDCVYSAGNVSPRREFLAPFDWRSGDFFSPGFFLLHDMARMMRWYSTLGVPFDAYVCDTSFTHARKPVRSRSKPLARMLQEAATVAVNGGAVGYWTYPLGNGAFVPSRMCKAIAVRKFIGEREPVFLGTQPVAWTAILISDPSCYALGGENAAGAHKALAALHRSPVVMDESGITEDMPFDLVVVPEQPFVDPSTAGRLAEYVRRGGKLLSSGVSIQNPQIRELAGVRQVQPGASQDGHVRLKTADEPTGIDRPWDRLRLAGAKELYPLYRSWDPFNPGLKKSRLANNWPMHGQLDEERPEPAGLPAAVIRRYGKGHIVHIATDLFTQYARLGDPQMLRWVREILEMLQPEPLLRTDAPSWVDVSLRRKRNDLFIHLINQNPGRDVARLNTDDLWVDEIPSIGPVTLWIRCPKSPKEVYLEPKHERSVCAFAKGCVRIEVPRLEIHACVVMAGLLDCPERMTFKTQTPQRAI